MVRVEAEVGEGFVGTIDEIAAQLTDSVGQPMSYTDAYNLVSFMRHLGVARKVGFVGGDGHKGRRADRWLLPAVLAVRSSSE